MQMTAPAPDALTRTFAAMHSASRQAVATDLALRRDRLERLQKLLHSNIAAFVTAIAADFGQRSAHETRLLEVFPTLESICHARRHVAGWMRPQRKSVSLWFWPGRAQIVPQPLGVIGIIVPWNYPLFLSLAPLAAALAAGNRALLKMSEFTPHTSDLLARLVAEHFAADEVSVIGGDAEIGAAFAHLPFDHLLFTGSTAVAPHILRAAAGNLTPVTLELGGKSPAIIGADAPLAQAAERIAVGKLMNAGQTCIAPDYVLVPADKVPAFIAALRAAVAKMYPQIQRSPDYSAIINARHYQRLMDLLADAQAQGAEVEPLSDGTADTARRLLPPVALLRVKDSMRVMQDEIFGPLLPILPYTNFDEALAYINARPRPLALYLFDRDAARIERTLQETIAGGVTINDTLLHVAQENLPFGGVGASGMGHYHGEYGFATFSKLKPVFRQSRLNGMGFFNPPFGRLFDRLMRLLLR